MPSHGRVLISVGLQPDFPALCEVTGLYYFISMEMMLVRMVTLHNIRFFRTLICLAADVLIAILLIEIDSLPRRTTLCI